MLKGRERRCHPRFRATHMHITACSLAQETPYSNGFKVNAVDYNHLGIGFDTRVNFSVGEQLELELRLGSTIIPKVIGIVRSRHDERYMIQFDFSSPSMQEETMITALEGLETQLKGSYSDTVWSTALRKMNRRDRYGE